jgi:hypothetical protein
MSSQPPFGDPADPDTQPFRKVGSGERKRAAVALTILAVAAAILVGVMLYVFGSSGGNDGPDATNNANPTGPAVQVTGGGSQTSESSSSQSTPASKPKTTASSTPPRTGPVSCPTTAPCTVPDDVGNALKALNDYRTANGQPAVTGSVTGAAKACALNTGNNCPSDYFWEPVGRSGNEVIQKISTANKGKSWLLDKSMTAVEIGWAYIPSSRSFECAMIAKH